MEAWLFSCLMETQTHTSKTPCVETRRLSAKLQSDKTAAALQNTLWSVVVVAVRQTYQSTTTTKLNACVCLRTCVWMCECWTQLRQPKQNSAARMERHENQERENRHCSQVVFFKNETNPIKLLPIPICHPFLLIPSCFYGRN